MTGQDEEPGFRDLPFEDLVAYWRERWLLPRADRVDGWRGWQRERIREMLILEETEQE